MPHFIKRFREWLSVKSSLDTATHKPPLFREREVWWGSVGENVGVEISGKGHHLVRPVLILRKLDAFSFIGLPTTSTSRAGSWFINLKIRDLDTTVILSQVRHFDYRRMENLMITISDEDFTRVKEKFTRLISGLK